MQKNNDVLQGWDFAAGLVGSDFAAQEAIAYVLAVEEAIKKLEHDINNHPYRGQDVAHFQGYVQEAWHAGTFNVNAVAAGSSDVARTLDSHDKWSVDIALDTGKNYQIEKQIKTAEEKVAAAKQKYDAAKAALKQLQEQKRVLQNEELVTAIANSKHSYDDIMNFLNSDAEANEGEQ